MIIIEVIIRLMVVEIITDPATPGRILPDSDM